MPPYGNSKGRLCGSRIAAMSAQRVVPVLEAAGVAVHAAARPPRGGGARFSIRTLGNGDYARGNGAYAKEETAITSRLGFLPVPTGTPSPPDFTGAAQFM